jgi:hypothetical protein
VLEGHQESKGKAFTLKRVVLWITALISEQRIRKRFQPDRFLEL